MAIDPIQSTPLRLVTPATHVRPARQDGVRTTAQPRAPRVDKVEIMRPQLPPASDSARAKMQRIRQSLVAATTEVPVHFDRPTPTAAGNVYTRAYLRFTADHAELNAGATERAAAD